MTVLRVQWKWLSTGGSEDDVVNTWHFKGPDTEADNAVDMVEDFYTVNYGGGAVATFYSGQFLSGTWEAKVYDLSHPEPRGPIYFRTGDFVMDADIEALPPECAVCLSYRAEFESGVNPARRKGRIYLGPWRAGVNDQGFVFENEVERIAIAGRELLEASIASVSMDWVVFSPTTAPTGTDPELGAETVIGGYVDNAWDIQRRRGVDPTGFSQFPDA